MADCATRVWQARNRLAAGVILARILNRTVVLPKFYCYCDSMAADLNLGVVV